MGIRVGAIINVIKAWGNYQDRLKYYRGRLVESQAEGNVNDEKYWDDSVKMTEAEIDEFMNVTLPEATGKNIDIKV